MDHDATGRNAPEAGEYARQVTGFDPAVRTWVIGRPNAEVAALPPLDGDLHTGAAAAEAADDYGHLVHRRPLGVLRAGSVSDIAVMLRFCADHRIPAAARGQGHSTHGQAQVEDGLVIDMSGLDDLRWESGNRISAQAGTRWSDVLRAALPHGRAPQVLTDYLELSVGGTLSVGGLGGASHHYGAQTDGVVELEVVTGTGETAVCSPTRRPDLFHAALAGLGQCAVITRATVETAPAPAVVRRYLLSYPTAAALTGDQRRLMGDRRFGYVEGQAQPSPENEGGWRYVLEAVAFPSEGTPVDDDALIGDLHHERGTEEIADLPFLDFADRMAPVVSYLESTGEWHDPHPWCNVLIPGSTVDAVVSSVMAELTPADIGPSGVVLLYPIRGPLLRTPLLRVPDEPLVFLFGLLKTATPGPQTPTAEEMVQANRRLYDLVRAHGGFQYPVGSVPMSPQDWRRHFGDRWAELAAAKRDHDPAAILTPGPGIFA